jgi:hypothetical protein
MPRSIALALCRSLTRATLALIVKTFSAAAQTSMPSAAGLAKQNTIDRQIIPVTVRYLVDDRRVLLGAAPPSVNAATTLFRVRVEAGHEQ